jgi:phosphatidylglycerol:prolipoprotein diacylglycerol transferase
LHPLLFHFGRIAIPTYGVLTAVALLAGLACAMLQARRLGLRSDRMWNLGLVGIIGALFGSRLLLVLANFEAFRAHPFWVLGLANIPGEWIALGGAAVGILAAIVYALAEGMPLLVVADAAVPGLALAFAINRLGAFCGGLAWGRPTALPWGVIYRSFVAYLWYRVPLGVKLHPVQLYDAAASLAIFVLLLAFRTRRAGEIAGAWLFLYGVARFFAEFFRGDEAGLIAGLTPPQVLAIFAVMAGGALWWRRPSEAPAVAAS